MDKVGKILLVGPKFHHYNHSVAKAFRIKGIDVVEFEYREPVDPLNVWSRLMLFFLGNLYKKHNLVELKRKLQLAIDSVSPDLIFFIKGNFLDKAFLEKISERRKFLWLMDSIETYPELQELIGCFDKVFCFEKSDVDKLLRLNSSVYYLPLAVDLDLYPAIKSCEAKKYDILFVGTLYKDRFKFLTDFAVKNKDLKFLIVGPVVGIGNKILSVVYSLIHSKRFIFRSISFEETVNLMQRSKIVLNIHHPQSVYGVNPRFFEIIVSGSFQIVDKKQFIDDYFGAFNVCQYEKMSDLTILIREVLSKSPICEFEEVRAKLISEVTRKHTFANRIDFVLSQLNL